MPCFLWGHFPVQTGLGVGYSHAVLSFLPLRASRPVQKHLRSTSKALLARSPPQTQRCRLTSAFLGEKSRLCGVSSNAELQQDSELWPLLVLGIWILFSNASPEAKGNQNHFTPFYCTAVLATESRE